MASASMVVHFVFAGEDGVADGSPDDLAVVNWQGPIPPVGQRVMVYTTPDGQWDPEPSGRAGVVVRVEWEVLPWVQHVVIVLRAE